MLRYQSRGQRGGDLSFLPSRGFGLSMKGQGKGVPVSCWGGSQKKFPGEGGNQGNQRLVSSKKETGGGIEKSEEEQRDVQVSGTRRLEKEGKEGKSKKPRRENGKTPSIKGGYT